MDHLISRDEPTFPARHRLDRDRRLTPEEDSLPDPDDDDVDDSLPADLWFRGGHWLVPHSNRQFRLTG